MSAPTGARARRVLGGLALVALAVVAFLAGMLAERVRYDSRRDAVLRRYDQALERHQQQIMETERQGK
jgi:hypothetical protein